MAGFLRFLVMPAVPAFVVLAVKSALPAVRRRPAARPLSRYWFAVPEVRFAPSDLGM